MKISSRLRKTYFYRAVFIAIFLTFIFGMLWQQNFDEQRILFQLLNWCVIAFISLITSFAIYIYFEDENYNKLEVDDEGVHIHPIFTNRVRKIKFGSIINFETTTRKLYSSRIPINDGFLATTFYTDKGKPFTISEDKFENYQELVLAITSRSK